ncbi:MAG TPA: hypothetical protein VMW36_07715, partial [Patescibacteria group bacterium]|nr:hypothetical protein [Patescibacteria group bacterium]
MERLWEQKWRSFRQTKSQSSPEYRRTANNIVGAPTEALLRELTHSEYNKVVDVVSDIDEKDLSFDNIFHGKKRIVIPFSPGPTGDIKRLVDLFKENDWQLNVEEGTVSKNFETQQGPQVRKIKVSKALTNLIRLKEKYVKAKEELAQDKAFTTFTQIRKDYPHPNVAYMDSREISSLLKHWNENNNFYKHNPEALQGETGKYSIVITRAPIDVLRMGDFDNITSCHSPPNRTPGSTTGGGYYECAVAEARGHGPIAYVVENSDVPEGFNWEEEEVFNDSSREIEGVTPISRLRMRKFTHNEKEYELAIPDVRVYGAAFPTLVQSLVEFFKTAQSDLPQPESLDVLTRWGGSYSDSEDGLILNNYYGGSTYEDYEEALHNGDDEGDEEDFEELEDLESLEHKCKQIEIQFKTDEFKHADVAFEVSHNEEGGLIVLMNGGMELTFDASEMVSVMPDLIGQQDLVSRITNDVHELYVEDIDFSEYDGKLVVRLMADQGNIE